jgi:protein SCO1/2
MSDSIPTEASPAVADAPPVASRSSQIKSVLGIAAVALGLTVGPTLIRWVHPATLPDYGHLPAFHLVDQTGAPVASDALLGHTTVVDFIFTRCASSCPRLTARMGELQARLDHAHSGAKLVSISVDPENDTPTVLTEYAARAHADAARWSFLTGPSDEIQHLVVSGFKVAASKRALGANDYDVIHGDWFVLIDHHGDVRAYDTTVESKDLDAIERGIVRLDSEK